MTDNVVPLRAYDTEPVEYIDVGNELHDLVELGLLEYTGDGTSTFHVTQLGVRVCELLTTLLLMTARDDGRIDPNVVAALKTVTEFTCAVRLE